MVLLRHCLLLLSSLGFLGIFLKILSCFCDQCYAEKHALGEVNQEILNTQVNPAVWEISGHMVLNTLTRLLRTMHGNYLPNFLCQRKDLKKLKLMFWKQQLLKRYK